jgi:uncharacterized repeat protein (TIGR03803 family)
MIGLWKMACIVTGFCIATAITSPTQTVTTIALLKGIDGEQPQDLFQGTDGNFYGAAWSGGDGAGTAFEAATSGKVTALYAFCAETCKIEDGGNPTALMQASNGNFYGTDENGGTQRPQVCIYVGCGTVFEITPDGQETTLHNFCSQADCADGRVPAGLLLQGTNGNLYGATQAGGNYGNGLCGTSSDYCGTIFEITLAGQLTTLYKFCSLPNCVDGEDPVSLVLATDGNFFGTTLIGGANGEGTFFEITPTGTLTTLSSFSANDGGRVSVQGSDGNFYGYGVSSGLIKITPSGQSTVLYTFCSQPNCADGESPQSLIQATDGNFYGVTFSGGTSTNNTLCERNLDPAGCGTIFEITPAGEFTSLDNYCSLPNCGDGSHPSFLIQGTDGNLYGTTDYGACSSGKLGCGVIFRVSTGLAPFIKTNPPFGKTGDDINILGNNLKGTTRVTFNGTPATFTVVSSSYIKASVPTGATTGTIQVTTPIGALSSNVAFQVLP